MSASSPASLDAATRTLVLRHVRTLITSTLAFFAQRQQEHLKILRAHLFELVDTRPHVAQAQHLRTAGGMLDKQADLFNRSFQAALKESIEEELESVLPGALNELRPAAQADEASGPVSMALLDVDEVERHLLVDRVAQRFNVRYEAKLTPLTQSLGVLLRIQDMSLADNPFRPATLVRAFSVAWQMAEFDPDAAEDFVLALEPQHGLDWTPLYAALTEMLVRAGFSAQPVHRIKRAAGGDSVAAPLHPGGAAKSGSGAPEQGGPRSGFASSEPARAPGSEPAPAAGAGIAARARQFLQKLGFGRKPADEGADEGGASAGLDGGHGGHGGGAGSGGMGSATGGPASYTPADSAFMGYLGGLQAGAGAAAMRPWVEGQDLREQNVLRQMRDREEVRRAPELDRGTVDALAEVFDYVFADRSIPLQLKIVIGRLQIPVLKAAMLDRDFFLTPEHPARKLVDALAGASVAWMPEKGETDPLYLRIEATVKRVLTEFENDLNLFGVLLAEFQAFLHQTEQQAQAQIEPTADQEQKSEALELALSHADEVIHQCINALPPGEPLVPFLLPFLTSQWREVMARAWLKATDAPAEWDDALSAMDQAIWSVQPKLNAEDRARLVALLPDLVPRLNARLDAIHWAGEERANFTRLLIATHMKAIRTVRTGSMPLDSGPGELEVKAGRDAIKALDERRARPLVPPQQDEFDLQAQKFTRGLWFDFVDDQGVLRRYRLGWVSPQRTRLLFTNREGFEAFVRSEREVAGLLREGRLAVIDNQPIVARAIEQIMSEAGQGEVDLELL